MDFKLKKPLEVMNKEAGEYETQDTIIVSFVGKKGLKSLKSLQDVIFKTFQDTASKSGEKKQKKEGDITIDDMLSMLDMTGNSERVFDSVMKSLNNFATIGKIKLNDQLQDEMDIEDLDELYQGGAKEFFVAKNYPEDEQYGQIAFDVCYFMNGGVQFEYLMERIDVIDFMRLKKRVEKLNARQKKESRQK